MLSMTVVIQKEGVQDLIFVECDTRGSRLSPPIWGAEGNGLSLPYLTHVFLLPFRSVLCVCVMVSYGRFIGRYGPSYSPGSRLENEGHKYEIFTVCPKVHAPLYKPAVPGVVVGHIICVKSSCLFF